MRSLAPDAPTAPTGSFAAVASRPRLLDDAAWSDLATEIAEATDRDAVADAVLRAAAELGVPVDTDAELVVLQRTFGVLHRLAVTA